MPKEIILLFTDYCTNMAFHAKSVNMTHNLEVPGSSPGWSTKKSQSYSEPFFVAKRLNLLTWHASKPLQIGL